MNPKLLIAGLSALAFLVGAPAPAAASLAACGNIHVEADATCELWLEGGCSAQCTPLSFEGSCAAELRGSCENARCSELPSLECTGSCDVASCQARCEVNPGEFDCQGECQAEAEAKCQGECSAADNRGECEASCLATFTGSCEGSCSGTPPSADCEARCEASCQGHCEAEGNLSCQVDCQAEGFAECRGRMQGSCEAACESPDGALFCDGQYIDHGGNLEACLNALRAYFNIEAEARGTASGECRGNRCTGQAEGEASAKASCAHAPWAASSLSAFGSGALLAGLSALVTRRRRRASSPR